MRDKIKRALAAVGHFFARLGAAVLSGLRTLGRGLWGRLSKLLHSRPRKKTVLKLAGLAAALAVLFGSTVLIISGSMRAAVSDFVTGTPQNAECIIVLGALVKADGTPSDMLADRLKVGVDLYLDGRASRLLMSGDGENDDYDEVEAMKKYALERGVPEEAILCDRYGLSTYDSIWRAKNVYGIKSLIIVTQEYHLYRAVYISEKLGIEVQGAASNLRDYAGQTRRDIREVAARFKDFFQVLLEGSPKYSEIK